MQILEPYSGAPKEEATTLPPPVRDIQFKITESKDNTDNSEDLVKILFMFKKDDFESFSAPDAFKIEIIKAKSDVETETFKKIISQTNINLPISSCQENLILKVKCSNSIGESEESIFILPFFRVQRVLLNSKLDVFLKEKKTLEYLEKVTLNNTSKIFLFYTDVLQAVIDQNFEDFNSNKFSGNPPEASKRRKLKARARLNASSAIISNLRFDQFDPDFTFGGSINGTFYFDKTETIDGWNYTSKEAIELYEEMKSIMDEYYEEYRLKYSLKVNDPFIMKFIWTHPVETNDSVIIYYMNQEGFKC